MLPSPDRPPLARWERMPFATIVVALGLALLLVVGAWSSSRGDADVHGALCLAPGASSPAAHPTDEAAAVDVLHADAAVCAVAVLCGIALVLLLRRLTGRGPRLPMGSVRRSPALVRAGPRVVAIASAPSLLLLSISRT